MASANGKIVVIVLDDKYMGKNGVVSDIKDAILIDVVRNGRFTSAQDTAKKYGINTSEFKELSFRRIVPPYEEQYYYPQDYSGHYQGLSYEAIRRLCWGGKILRDGLELSKDDEFVNDIKVSDLVVCLVCDAKDVEVLKKSIFIRSMDGYTDIDNLEVYNDDRLSLAISKDGRRTLEQGYSYSAIFKEYLSENNLTEDDRILLSTLKEQVREMNKKENNKQEEKELY